MSRPRLGVLVSGRGSNLQALIDAQHRGRLEAEIALVISNRPGVPGLTRASEAGIAASWLDPRPFGSRVEYDHAVAGALEQAGVTLVCLAGYMRLVTPAFLGRFPDAVLNIHPSLLPAFPGLDAQRQAWEFGVSLSGATVHLVTAELDAGPIVAQEAVPVLPSDTAESLAARILEVEHRLYPAAVQRVLHEPWRLVGRRVVWGVR